MVPGAAMSVDGGHVTTRVYISGSSREIPRVQRAMELARSWGWEVTHDWTIPVETMIREGVAEHELSERAALEAVHDDFDGIRGADVVWLLLPHEPTTGAWVEWGMALATGSRVRKALTDAASALDGATPVPCPVCGGEGCQRCGGQGWLPKIEMTARERNGG